MFEHLTVRGYAYDRLTWALCEPAMVPRGPMGYNLREHLFEGGVVEATVPADGPVNQDWAYQVKLDLTPAAVGEAHGVLVSEAGDEFDDDAPIEAIGIARIRRFASEAEAPEAGEHRVALEDLDRSHLMDRLTGAILSWHADLQGEGPYPKNQAA